MFAEPDVRPNAARRRRAALAGVVMLLAAALGACEPNTATPFLTPTGVRPAPATGTAGVTGRVVYDPVQSPDLVDPPYPPTLVELRAGADTVALMTLPRDQRTFQFDSLPPGTYTVYVHARQYLIGSAPPIAVTDGVREIGDVVIPMDILHLTSGVSVVGEYNEFFDADTCWMQLRALGVWFGPNVEPSGLTEEPPDTAVTLAAGDHRLRLILNGLPDDPSYAPENPATLEPPVTGVPLRIAEGAERDFPVHISVAGRYRFVLDERRLTLDIEHLPAAPTRPSRRPSP